MFRTVYLAALFVKIFLQSEPKEFWIQGFAQGTSYSVKYIASDAVVTRHALDSIFARLDSSLSIYKPYSLISQFNNSERGIAMDQYMADVVARSQQISIDSRGRFDITVGPLVAAWTDARKNGAGHPGKNELKRISQCVDYRHVKRMGNFLSKSRRCVMIDVDGIAQGYSVDIIAKFLEEKGLKNFLVEIGGEVRASGSRLNGEPFRVGIARPGKNRPNSTNNHIVKLRSGALTSSGQSGLMEVPRSQYINPRTGTPVKGDIIAVTVYAADAITADGYDNVLMTMKLREAIRFVEKRPLLAAYFVYRKSDGTVEEHFSSQFKNLLN